MKTTENKTKRLEVRLTQEEMKLLKIAAISIGQTPSELVRMFISSTIVGLKMKVQQGEIRLEDFEALLDNQL